MNNIVNPNVPSVTFKDFAKLAKQKGWSAQFLAEKFRGKIEGPSEFFHRCLSGDSAPDGVVAYRSVIDFYLQQLNPLVKDASARVCLCGCLRRVYGRKKYATGYCRKKACLKRSRDRQEGSKKDRENLDVSVTFSPSRLDESQGNTLSLKKALNGQESGGAERTWKSL